MAIKSCLYKDIEFNISYEIVNPQNKKAILILHGWGSNKEIMKQAFGGLLPNHKHVYVDMPGFGRSGNDTILTSIDYANIIKILMDNLNIVPDIIMGHSFGGKVATLLNPNHLVLLSSSGILVPKSLKVKTKIVLTKILRGVGLGRMRAVFASEDVKGMSHEMYETFKNVVNEEFEYNFINVKSKTQCFWGKSDTATPLWTGEKISSLIVNSKLYPLEGDHFFFLKHNKFISREIEEFY